MKKHYALQLYDYHVWANNKIFARLKELPGDVYDRDIQSVFSSIADTLVHKYMTDTIWLGVMQEKSMDVIQASMGQAQEKAKDKRLETMEAVFHELTEEYEDFFGNVTNLDKELAPEHPRIGRLEASLPELVQHVVNHGTYHRGNIAAMLRQQGHPGVATDYVYYLYDIRAAK